MMLRLAFVLTVGKLIAWPIRRRFRALERAAADPRSAQEYLLRQILALQTDTQFGRNHGFAKIQNLVDFRRQVPVAPYEYVQPYIEKVQGGDTRALLTDPGCFMSARPRGPGASQKFTPLTPPSRADSRRGGNMGGQRALRAHRRAVAMRPIVQLVGDPDEFRTEAGIPCGSISGFSANI